MERERFSMFFGFNFFVRTRHNAQKKRKLLEQILNVISNRSCFTIARNINLYCRMLAAFENYPEGAEAREVAHLMTGRVSDYSRGA